MVAISASVASASASRVTAVPRKSWNVSPTTPAALQALPHDARKPSDVHGLPSLLVRMIVESLGAASSAALSGAPTLDHDARPGLRSAASGYACRHIPTMAAGGGRLAAAPSIAPATAASGDAPGRARKRRPRRRSSKSSRCARRCDIAYRRARMGWCRSSPGSSSTTTRGREPSTHSRLAVARSRQGDHATPSTGRACGGPLLPKGGSQRTRLRFARSVFCSLGARARRGGR